ncbi:MAG: hypothetical protein GX256_10035 [Fretibacterium sp.]|nr:hypothetical protein [Fretibacterium sp.]
MERCSRRRRRKAPAEKLRAAAIVLGAAALFLNVLPCSALELEGLPDWLAPGPLRSLEAVWEEIPDSPDVDRLKTLQLVAERLLSGYSVTVVAGREGPCVTLSPLTKHDWDVALELPDLRSPVDLWFEHDVRGLDEELRELVQSLPLEGLSWADSALRGEISKHVEGRLPGWGIALQIRLSDDRNTLCLSFRPNPPLVLAVTPTLYSGTLPVMLQSDLAAKLAPGLSPIIGLPVPWVARHKGDIEALAQDFLSERHTVSNVRAKAKVSFTPGQVSSAFASVDSERFLFRVWLAATAGMRGSYPELGLTLGWNTRHITGLDLELYGEAVAELDDFSLLRRLGARFLFFGELRVGAELEWPGSELFYRLQWDACRLKRPYLWWRWGPDWGHEGALGYRFTEHVSLELYYKKQKGSDQDRVGLRGVLSL